MKKLFTLFLALVANVGIIYASDTQVNGIWYDFNKSNKTATVTYRGSSYDSYDNEYSGSVVIPSSVTYNGTTYSVTSIGDYAFCYCSSLTSITIPNSVTYIGYAAFYGCSSLTSVTIPNSVTHLGNSAFEGCSSLTSVTINSDAIVNKAHSSSYHLSDRFGSQVTKYIIGDNVKGIGDYAFCKCSSLTSVTIPNSVTSIGKYAFEGCSSLTSVTIHNSVTSIGVEAFYECSSLTSVTINSDAIVNKAYTYSSNLSNIFGSQVTEYMIGDNVKGIGDYAFCKCSSLTSITIPNSVTSIGDDAFYYCSSLTSVTIPNSVTSIGHRAFDGCSSLTSMTIPNSVKRIEYSAFEGCKSLTSVTIPNSVTSIGDYAFYRCSSLTSVTIPNSVTWIGKKAFYECSSLTSVTINSDAIVNKAYTYSSNLSDIFGSQVIEYIIGDNVKGIGEYAFEGCSSLTSVTIPNSVTSIEESAFDGCSSLTSVTIPNSVTSIASSAFSGCSSLTSVTIPNSVTSIGEYAFYYCTSLTSVTIPNSVTSIGEYAFYYCTSLTSITCKATTPPTVGQYAFDGVSKSISVHVPCGCVEAYKAANGWEDFTNIQGPLAEYSITVGVNATQMGTAKVDINNACGAQISAKPNIGYHFVQWSDGVVNNPRSIVLTQDTVLIAEFAEIPSYVVEVIYNPDHGTVNGQGTYKEDEKVILTATANDGYKFHKWSNGVTDNPYTFIVKSDVTLEAKFTSTEGIEDVQSDEVLSTKVIKDGQIYILRNGKTYTMQGQEVK